MCVVNVGSYRPLHGGSRQPRGTDPRGNARREGRTSSILPIISNIRRKRFIAGLACCSPASSKPLRFPGLRWWAQGRRAGGGMVDDLPTIQRWLNRILALPIALQNGIFDEFLGLVEARIDAARQAGTLDIGVDHCGRAFRGADRHAAAHRCAVGRPHLLELEIARALEAFASRRAGRSSALQVRVSSTLRNARSGLGSGLPGAKSARLRHEGTRVAR